jgi:ketosteroid isomerase-like protein
MSEDDVARLRELYDAFGRGDIPAVLGALDEDIHWNVPEVLPHGMHVHGRDAVGGFFEKIGATWDGLSLDLGDFVASGDRICVIGTARGKLGGTEAGYGFVHAWTVRDGALVAFDEFVDPDPAIVSG